MIKRFALVQERILQDLALLEQVVARAEKGMKNARTRSEDADLFLDSVALNLHDFYSGLERLFQYIAANVDQNVPSGRDWHRDLLQQMNLRITNTRPAILTAETLQILGDYLRFRHVVRNVYAFQFDFERLERLVDNLRPTYDRIREDLRVFAVFLKEIGLESQD